MDGWARRGDLGDQPSEASKQRMITPLEDEVLKLRAITDELHLKIIEQKIDLEDAEERYDRAYHIAIVDDGQPMSRWRSVLQLVAASSAGIIAVFVAVAMS